MPTIRHADWSNRPRTAFRRWTQAVHQVVAIQVGRHRCWRALTASWRQKGKRKQIFPRDIRAAKLPSNPSPLTLRNNQIQILETRNHGSQRLSASYQHTRHVVVTRTHAHTTRDKGTKALTVVSGEVRAELTRLFLSGRPSSIAPRWVKGGRQELECTQSGLSLIHI